MSAEGALSVFREKFRLDTLAFYEDSRWIVSVRPEQITLGSVVMSSAVGHRDLSALGVKDGAGFAVIMGFLERVARESFGAARLNVLCLMMKDPIVHFHVLPRYESDVERYGRTWVDEDWPGPPTMRPAPTSEETLSALVSSLSQEAAALRDENR